MQTMLATVFHGVNDIRVDSVNVVQSGRFDPAMLLTHRFKLADIKQGYEVFGNRAEGVLKVLITP